MIGWIIGIIFAILFFKYVLTPFWGLNWKSKIAMIAIVAVFVIFCLIIKNAGSASISL